MDEHLILYHRGQGTRAFFSAAIVKRHDTVTLETTDGITITLIGFINRSLTAENGSPSEARDPLSLHYVSFFITRHDAYTPV